VTALVKRLIEWLVWIGDGTSDKYAGMDKYLAEMAIPIRQAATLLETQAARIAELEASAPREETK